MCCASFTIAGTFGVIAVVGLLVHGFLIIAAMTIIGTTLVILVVVTVGLMAIG